eukprot:1712170-Prymnesium_polylepis.2
MPGPAQLFVPAHCLRLDVRQASAQLAARCPYPNAPRSTFGQRVHCIAAEPKDTILRLGVIDAGQEVAYEA